MDIKPHPQFLEVLFAFKNKVSMVFQDVLGIHEIHHLSLTRINKNNQLITFSSTPALEYNLFSSQLWLYDKTYNPQWYQQYTQSNWQNLYQETRYDELYYLKQIKHNYPLGLSLAAKINETPVIYSLASNKSCRKTEELFTQQQEEFYKIGLYCYTLLDTLFNYCDSLQVDYELSK
ncbi:MAG: hypothetical protein WC627_02145 [Legionella sp.]|jgi:hypothetical protein